MGGHPGTPRAIGNTWCTRQMAKPRPQVGRVCYSAFRHVFPNFVWFKGAVSRYSVIFCAFLREQKMAVARASVADIRPESLAVLAWQYREPTTSRARVALLHLSTATGSTFVFRLRGPSKVISPSSRFKISSDSYIDIDSLFSCLVLRAFRSLLRRSCRREHGWLGEGIGSVVVAPFPVTLTMCVTDSLWRQMRWTRNEFEERMSTFVPTPALLWHSHSTWQRLEDSRNALVVSCGDVQVGDRGRSKETLRALACRRFSSSLPEGALLSTAHPAVHLEMRRW